MTNKQSLISLTIAGSDSGSGAGLQADLKTFSYWGVYAACVITCVTAQNTTRLTANYHLDLTLIQKQLDQVLSDFDIKYIKIGMLPSLAIVNLIANYFKRRPQYRLIFDPVLVCKQGYNLTNERQNPIVQAMITEMMPLALLTTPNIQEAEVLSGRKINTLPDVVQAARIIKEMGATNVLITGGHLPKSPDDFLLTKNNEAVWVSGIKATPDFSHGAGCTLSSSITALLTKKYDLIKAVKVSKRFVSLAMENGLRVGAGINPLNHFNFLPL